MFQVGGNKTVGRAALDVRPEQQEDQQIGDYDGRVRCRWWIDKLEMPTVHQKDDKDDDGSHISWLASLVLQSWEHATSQSKQTAVIGPGAGDSESPHVQGPFSVPGR
jgi:hypothetical protein